MVKRAVEETIKLTLDIPRIAVVPKGEINSGFHPFTLNLSGLHLQPRDRSLVPIPSRIPPHTRRRTTAWLSSTSA